MTVNCPETVGIQRFPGIFVDMGVEAAANQIAAVDRKQSVNAQSIPFLAYQRIFAVFFIHSTISRTLLCRDRGAYPNAAAAALLSNRLLESRTEMA